MICECWCFVISGGPWCTSIQFIIH